MICKICKKDIKVDNILRLLTLHHICNDCKNTFQYKCGSVKIESVEIIVKTLRNYNQIKVFNEILWYDYNDYCLRNIIRKKHYYYIKEIDINKVSNEFIKQKEVILLFYEEEYQLLLQILLFISEGNSTIRKIIALQLIK